MKIAVTDSQMAANGNNVDMDRISMLRAELPSREELAGLVLTPLEFEKDDDSNFHMDFIVAASNLRAINYKIPPADRHKSKLIAGELMVLKLILNPMQGKARDFKAVLNFQAKSSPLLPPPLPW